MNDEASEAVNYVQIAVFVLGEVKVPAMHVSIYQWFYVYSNFRWGFLYYGVYVFRDDAG